MLYALCVQLLPQVYCSYEVFFVARFVFLSEWNEVMCVCTPCFIVPGLALVVFCFIREDEVNYCCVSTGSLL